jgi:hypothetical protein
MQVYRAEKSGFAQGAGAAAARSGTWSVSAEVCACKEAELLFLTKLEKTENMNALMANLKQKLEPGWPRSGHMIEE